MNTAVIVNPDVEKAHELHVKIMTNGKLAAEHLVEHMRCLKEMRDSELYRALGHEDFETYTVEMVGLRARQAYYYISVLEELGPRLVEENAGLGITKLKLLAQVMPLDRPGFMETHDLDGMSTEELRAEVEKARGLGEQVSLLEDELEKARAEAADPVDTAIIKAELREELEAEIRAEVVDSTEKEKQAAVHKAEQVAAMAAEKQAEQELKEALEEAAEKAEAEKTAAVEQALAAQRAENAAELARVGELEKQLELAGSSESARFAVWFEQFGHAFEQMWGLYEEMLANGKEAEGERLLAAVDDAFDVLTDRLAEVLR